MAGKHIVLIGIDPALIDWSAVPGRDASHVRAAGAGAEQRLRELGHTVSQCLVDFGATAEAAVVAALAARPCDCVMIGAGIRAAPQHTRLFETIVNAVRRQAPGAALCFNSSPDDTLDAVLRWL
ncbi:MAG TPA: hypothetical protein VGE07_01215 [Herpetosiphonaceae bacterium]